MANAVLEFAKTGRSKCATTGAEIPQGGARVGIEIWRVGRRCMTYQTPDAFLSRLKVAVALDDRSKCKLSGARITKGDLCVLFSVGGAKGETPTLHTCNLRKAAGLVANVAEQAKSPFSRPEISGMVDLSVEQRREALKLLAPSGKASKVPPPRLPQVAKRPAANAAESSRAKRSRS